MKVLETDKKQSATRQIPCVVRPRTVPFRKILSGLLSWLAVPQKITPWLAEEVPN